MSARWAGVGLGLALLGLAACGGGSSSGSSSNSGSGSAAPVNNVQPVVSNLGVTDNYADGLFTSVTVCVPGTANCQTIDNILVDTGSFGLRLLGAQVNLPLPLINATSGSPLAECTEYVDSYTWGPVVTADIQIAGETASAVPTQLLGEVDGVPSAPMDCTNSGLPENDTQALLGANGILGVGVFRYDCGDGCAPPQTSVPAIYFSCPSTGCSPTLVALQDQVQNPVSLFPADNNGLVISLPAVSATGAASVTGTMTFGIGTQADNLLGTASVLTADGYGDFNTIFQGTEYSGSLLDTGSNGFFFLDSTTLNNLPLCPDGNSGFYCPNSTASYTATNESASPGLAATSATATWEIANAAELFDTGNASFNNLGGPNPGYFDFGLPFFFGRSVFIGIYGSSAGTAVGPFYAY